MKTAISLPDELFGAAERAAKRLGLSRSELFRRALAAFLEQQDDRRVTQALNQVYSDQDTENGLDREIGHMQAVSVPADEW